MNGKSFIGVAVALMFLVALLMPMASAFKEYDGVPVVSYYRGKVCGQFVSDETGLHVYRACPPFTPQPENLEITKRFIAEQEADS